MAQVILYLHIMETPRTPLQNLVSFRRHSKVLTHFVWLELHCLQISVCYRYLKKFASIFASLGCTDHVSRSFCSVLILNVMSESVFKLYWYCSLVISSCKYYSVSLHFQTLAPHSGVLLSATLKSLKNGFWSWVNVVPSWHFLHHGVLIFCTKVYYWIVCSYPCAVCMIFEYCNPRYIAAFGFELVEVIELENWHFMYKAA
jgi:hypothetical protein